MSAWDRDAWADLSGGGAPVGRAGELFSMLVSECMAALESLGDPEKMRGRARYGLPEDKTFGVPMPALRRLARHVGKNHDLALALWALDQRDARLLAFLIADPARIDAPLMETWALSFDNWGECDTACCNCFDRSPLAWDMAGKWSTREEEFVRRSAFAIMAGLAVHDKKSPDERFLALFPLMRHASSDGRNYVRKAVNWALRQVGKRSLDLREAAVAAAKDILAAGSASGRWIARDALRELENPKTLARVGAKRRSGV